MAAWWLALWRGSNPLGLLAAAAYMRELKRFRRGGGGAEKAFKCWPVSPENPETFLTCDVRSVRLPRKQMQERVRSRAAREHRQRNPFNGFHMSARPNTCAAFFIAILKPLQIFYALEEKQRRRECCSVGGVGGGGGSLIVCSLTVFYVTTTHGFSSTCGWVPGMCFLSLFLMTRVASQAAHMLGAV